MTLCGTQHQKCVGMEEKPGWNVQGQKLVCGELIYFLDLSNGKQRVFMVLNTEANEKLSCQETT